MSELDQKSLMERVAVLENLLNAMKSQDRSLKYFSGETTISSLDPGDTAWMLVATALVLFMTIPGLALYYAGMVRTKNVLASVIQVYIFNSSTFSRQLISLT
jgi:hypothetical protein